MPSSPPKVLDAPPPRKANVKGEMPGPLEKRPARRAVEKGEAKDGELAKPSKLQELRRRFGGADAGERRLLDLVLTAPVFFVYHIGVVFLSVRNGVDPITDQLLRLLHGSLAAYLGLTFAIAAVLAGFVWLTRAKAKLNPAAFALRLGEAAIYAVLMCVVAKAAVTFQFSFPSGGGKGSGMGVFPAVVMSMGAGFYEEIAFRVLLFGGGVWVLDKLRVARSPAPSTDVAIQVAWAIVAALCFSAVHYVGSLGDKFTLSSFVFRLVCGLFLTLVFRLRGFATAVWTHALYDVGVMAL